MALKLHGAVGSPAALRALAALYEKDVDFEFVPISFANREHKSPKFLALNPFGQVPAFEHGDLTLFESRAIAKYVAEAYADKGTCLILRDPKKSAIQSVWMEVENQKFDPATSKLSWELVFKPMFGQKTDETVVAEFEKKLENVLDVYEQRLELTQVEELAKVINPVVLTQSPDSWSWTLNNSGGYTVVSSRNMIDSRLLPKGDLKTRWIRYVLNKVNTFAWKVMTNSLPTRFNISRRGIDIESLSCVNCDVGIETNDHLFFACNTAKKISKLINRWWDVPFMDINSYGEWRSWIDNVKLPKKNKSMFQGIYFVMWWLLWNFRNKKMFEAKPKSKETFFDEIICSSYYWCRYRCNTLFSWDDWYKNPSLISL
ncbi:RNA-directed DNA polymerase, eukaryota, reverse transcriptase zinc-binding domain protein [Tanacetum coccineum]